MNKILLAILLLPVSLFGAGLTVSTTNGFATGLTVAGTQTNTGSIRLGGVNRSTWPNDGSNGIPQMNGVGTNTDLVNPSFPNGIYGTGGLGITNSENLTLRGYDIYFYAYGDTHGGFNTSGFFGNGAGLSNVPSSFNPTNLQTYAGTTTNSLFVSGLTGGNDPANGQVWFSGTAYTNILGNNIVTQVSGEWQIIAPDSTFTNSVLGDLIGTYGYLSGTGSSDTPVVTLGTIPALTANGLIVGNISQATNDSGATPLFSDSPTSGLSNVLASSGNGGNQTISNVFLVTSNFIVNDLFIGSTTNCGITTDGGAYPGYSGVLYSDSTNCHVITTGRYGNMIIGNIQSSQDVTNEFGQAGAFIQCYVQGCQTIYVNANGYPSHLEYYFQDSTNITIQATGVTSRIRLTSYTTTNLTVVCENNSATADFYTENVSDVTVTLGEGASIHGTLENANNVTIDVPAYTHVELGTSVATQFAGDGSGLTNLNVTGTFPLTSDADAGANEITNITVLRFTGDINIYDSSGHQPLIGTPDQVGLQLRNNVFINADVSSGLVSLNSTNSENGVLVHNGGWVSFPHGGNGSGLTNVTASSFSSYRSGQTNIANLATSVRVNFSSDIGTTNYAVTFGFEGTISATAALSATAKDESGFTANIIGITTGATIDYHAVPYQ